MTRALLISAPASGSGKTVLTLGILRALRARFAPLSGKSGPDYIDPAFHAAATGRACLTLDAWAEPPEALRARAAAGGGALLVIEGAMGLFDGADLGDGGGTGGGTGAAGSSADLAAALGAPVLLVLDAARMAQTAGALVAGLAAHRRDVNIAGVILNRVGSARHAAMLTRAVTPVAPVLGAVPRDAALDQPSRHLGLVQAGERADLERFLQGAARVVAAHCDLEAIAALARPLRGEARPPGPLAPLGQRIAVARDVAFAFAYGHMLEGWRDQGAEILPFSPLADEAPAPDADAVFLPGGYPELHAPALAAAEGFKAGLRALATRGARIYGECGGYMALGAGLEDAGGARHAMLGLLRLETSFANPRRQLGYRRLTPRPGAPWSAPLAGHEHHQAVTLGAAGAPLFDMADASGAPLGPVGLIAGNVSGSFAHVIAPGPWAPLDRSCR